MPERFPIFRLKCLGGHIRIYNTANHESVKDEETARAAFLADTGYEPHSVSSFSFDELNSAHELADFALHGIC